MESCVVDVIAAARGGNEEARLALLERCRPQLQRFANNQCRHDEAEEAVQEALWLVYQHIGTLNSINAFSTWLFQIVRRTCIQRTRNRSRTVSLEEHQFHLSASHVDVDLRLDLMQAIHSLPKKYREVLVLCDIKGFSSRETAENLSISTTAAKSRLHRARKMVWTRLRNK